MYSQHTLSHMNIIDEQFDSNMCTTNINLEFTLNHTQEISSNNPRKYTLFIKNRFNTTIENIDHNPNIGNVTTHTTGNISITSRTIIRIMVEYEAGGRRGGTVRSYFQHAEIIKCINDIDDDGVLNDDDNCPDIYGNFSNFGCPGNPDLVIDESLSIQYSDCSVCTSSIYETAFLNDDVPTIYRFGGNATIKPLIVKNIGDGNPQINYTKLSFYLSSDRELSSDDFKFEQRTLNISPLPEVGESTPTSYNLSYGVSLEGLDIGSNKSYGTYYILIVIDEDNTLNNSEINTSNNISSYKVKYTGTQPTSSAFLDIILFDIYGFEIINKKVKDENEARVLFNNLVLQEGLYFLNIYNNGLLIKKIKLYKKIESIIPKQQ